MSKRSSLLVRGRVRSRSVRLPVACPWLQRPALGWIDPGRTKLDVTLSDALMGVKRFWRN